MIPLPACIPVPAPRLTEAARPEIKGPFFRSTQLELVQPCQKLQDESRHSPRSLRLAPRVLHLLIGKEER